MDVPYNYLHLTIYIYISAAVHELKKKQQKPKCGFKEANKDNIYALWTIMLTFSKIYVFLYSWAIVHF